MKIINSDVRHLRKNTTLILPDLAESFWTPSPEFEQRLLEAIKQTWVYIEDHTQHKRWVPDPSTIRETLQKSEKRDFTLPEFTEKVREHMQISENTIRREIKRGVIQCYQTEGGHRRIPYQELELYLYRCRNIESGL